jgi:serine/threonine-protein kinase
MAEIGSLLDGKYRILRRIGDGSMGVVYEAEHVRISRRIAIKVLHRDLVRDSDLVERFEREAQAAARIGSIYIADVIDLGELPTGERYIVMEYLDGESLWERLAARGPMAPHDLMPIADQLLRGLTAVHAAGIVHRDLKPANIFLCRAEGGDFVKILDLGVCKFYMHEAGIITTGGGRILGTPGYMAPEQIVGDAIDPRADVYSVGVILYRCASGKTPFAGGELREVLARIREGKARPLAEVLPDVEPGFAAIVSKAMARAPDERFPDAPSLRAALTEWSERARGVSNLLAEYLERPAPAPPERSSERIAPRATSSRSLPASAPEEEPTKRKPLTAPASIAPAQEEDDEVQDTIRRIDGEPRRVSKTVLMIDAPSRSKAPRKKAQDLSVAVRLTVGICACAVALALYWLATR